MMFTDVDECAAIGSGCGNGHCINTPGSYRCDCFAGYQGANCDASTLHCAAILLRLIIIVFSQTLLCAY